MPFDKAGADLLFGFISRRYERGSLVVTTNLPFARWSEVFLDATAAAAVIDRIVHHATVLTTNGDRSLRSAVRRSITWQNSSQRQRWLATALLDIEPRLRKVMGYRHLPRLRDALKRELKIDTTTSKTKAA